MNTDSSTRSTFSPVCIVWWGRHVFSVFIVIDIFVNCSWVATRWQ